MGLRKNLKNMASTFVTKDAKPLVGSISPEKQESPFEYTVDKKVEVPAVLRDLNEKKDDIEERGAGRAGMSRANKIYQSFTVGLNRSNADTSLFTANK